MAKRTYQPTLIFLARAILAYVAKYRDKINKNLTSEQIALLDALISAATSLLSVLEIDEAN